MGGDGWVNGSVSLFVLRVGSVCLDFWDPITSFRLLLALSGLQASLAAHSKSLAYEGSI